MDASAFKTRLLASAPDPGHGGGMQLLVHRSHLYLGHLSPGGGTTVLDVRDPRAPRIAGHVPGYPGTYSPKVQIGDGLLLVNYEERNVPAERVGLGVLDIGDPAAPREIGFLPTGGKGVHRMWYVGGRYAYISAVPDGFRDRMLLIVDLADPTRPEVAGRWWIPGLAVDEPPPAAPGLKYNLHHAVVQGDRAYMGCWDYGVVVLDVSEPAHPRELGHVGGWARAEGGNTHTALPLLGRGLLAVTDESVAEDGNEPPKYVRVFDMPEPAALTELARCPVPEGPYRGVGRFGPHNLHENQPGAFQSEDLLFVSYFAGGLRVYDIREAGRPREVAHYVPAARGGRPGVQTNDLFVDANGLIYLSDRVDGVVDIVEMV